MAISIKSISTSNGSIAPTWFFTKAALFHSTPLLNSKRKSAEWKYGGGPFRDSKRNHNHSRRFRKMHPKHTLFSNVSEFAEHMFQSWRANDDFSDPSSKGTSWSKEQGWAKGKGRTGAGSQGPQWGNSRNRGDSGFRFGNDEDVEAIFGFAFREEGFGDDKDVEDIFGFPYREEGCSAWSFTNHDRFQWESSSYTNNHKWSWNWRNRREDNHDTYKEPNDDLESDIASDRLSLGLNVSGPLKLDDVKSAYRACALKWHPDRHQGSFKAVAEEKFKLCSKAYQSLCDKL